MSIQVSRYGGPLGSFSEEEIREGLRTGRFFPTDLGVGEGMTEPKALSDFPQFAASPEPTATPPPVQPAVIAAPNLVSAIPAAAATGLPWENRSESGFFEAFFQTVIMVLTRPAEAFDRMRKEGGLMDPLIYALIGGSAGLIVSLLFSVGMNSMSAGANQHGVMGALLGVGLGTMFGAIIGVMVVPFLVAMGVFVGAAIIHVCLLIVGGANKPFETTFRVLCFSSGSTHLLMLVPFCGGMIAGIWGLVVNCIGLARAHQTDTWRAVLAIFLPMIVCCGGIILCAIFFGTLGALGLQNRH